jgi:hypothetical protein
MRVPTYSSTHPILCYTLILFSSGSEFNYLYHMYSGITKYAQIFALRTIVSKLRPDQAATYSAL